MSAIQRIDSLYDENAINAQNKRMIMGLREMLATMDEVQKGINSVYNSKGGSGLKTATDELNKSQLALQQQVIKTQKVLQEQEKTEQQQIKTMKARQQQQNAGNAAAAREKKDAEDLMNDYKQLSLAYNDAAMKAKVYALRFGETHPSTVQAIKDAKDMYNVLYRLDQTVGQNQRNVGNYKSAFDGLGMSITQVARELPSLAISPATFLLAISNNLPMVQDEIRKAKDEINNLKAAGKDAPSLFSRFSSAIFSSQVGLSILVAVLTLLGPKIIDFISNLFSGANALEKQRKELQELTNAHVEANKAREDYNNTINHGNRELEDELALLKAGNVIKEEQLRLEKMLAENKKNAAVSAFSNQADADVSDNLLDEEERVKKATAQMAAYEVQMGEAEGALNRFLTTMHRGESTDYSMSMLSEKDYDAEKERLQKEYDGYKSLYESKSKVLDNYRQAKSAFDQQDATETAYYNEQATKSYVNSYSAAAKEYNELLRLRIEATLQSAKLNAEANINANQRALNDDRSTEEEKIKATQSIAAQRRAIAHAEYVARVAEINRAGNAEGTSEEQLAMQRLAALKDYNAERKQINLSSAVDENKIREDYRRRDLAAQLSMDKDLITEKELYEKELSASMWIGVQERIAFSNEYYANQRRLAEQQFKYDMDIAKATGKTTKELQAIQVAYNLKIVQLNAEGQKDITAILEKELAHRKELIDDSFTDIALEQAKVNASDAAAYAQETASLTHRYNNKKISYEKYLRELDKLDIKYANKQVFNTIDTLQKQLHEYEATYPDITKTIRDTEQQIAATAILLSKATTDAKRKELSDRLDFLQKELDEEKRVSGAITALRTGISTATSAANKVVAGNTKKTRDQILADLADIIEKVKQSADVAFTLITGLNSASIDRQKNALADLEERQQRNYEREVQRVQDSTMTEEAKANRLKVMESVRLTQKEQNERRQQQLDLQRAKYEKAQAVANIIIQGALATVKAFGRSVFEGIAMAALTAAQLAVAVATPLPRFAKGTQSSPEGFAWVGEEGKELRIEPTGEMSMTPSKPTLSYLKQGTQIVPSYKVADYLSAVAMSRLPRYQASATDNFMQQFTTTVSDALTVQTAELRKLNKKKVRTTNIINVNTQWGDYRAAKVKR